MLTQINGITQKSCMVIYQVRILYHAQIDNKKNPLTKLDTLVPFGSHLL